jgi:hypothetical protein
MKKYFLVPILASVLSLSFIGPANANAATVTSVKWTVNPLNVGALDPDVKSSKVGLRIKISDADGISSGYVRISRPMKTDSHMYFNLKLMQGSGENGTWGADVSGFWSGLTGKWIVSGVYLKDSKGVESNLQNMKVGFGGATGVLDVSTGKLGLAKIAAPKVLNLAWKDMGDDVDWKPIPFRFIVTPKDPKGKKLVGAFVRLTVCVTIYDEDDEVDEEAIDDELICSYVSLGKTNSKGVLIKEIHASQIASSEKYPIWADEAMDINDYWADVYDYEWSATISVLKTGTTAYTEYGKVIKLYDSIDDGRCLKAGC